MGVVGRFNYYAKKNCLIGFSNPLQLFGFNCSNVRTAKDILNQFDDHDWAR